MWLKKLVKGYIGHTGKKPDELPIRDYKGIKEYFVRA